MAESESGDGKEGLESMMRDWRFGVMMLKVRADGERGMLNLIFIGEPGLHLAPHAIPDSRAQKSSHGIGPDDLLWDGDGEARGSALE